MATHQITPSQPRPFPTLDQVWMIAALVLVALRPLLTPIPPHDFWWHMAMGREIVQSGTIPREDTFSYTQAGEPFYNQGWLAQVAMYELHKLGGVPLLLVVQAGVVALAYGLLLWLCIRRTGMVRLSVGILLLAIMPISFDNWNVRPQTYAFPLFVAFLLVLDTWRTPQRERGGARLWLLPLLMIGWVNLHGSFVLGGGLIAFTFIVEAVRRPFLLARRRRTPDSATDHPLPDLRQLFVWGGITAATMLLNPRGIGVLGYVRDLLSTSAVTNLVTEWAPPTIRDTSGALFFAFLIGCGVVLAYARRPPDPLDMLLAVAFLWLALGASRNVVWFGMVAAPLLIGQIAGMIRPEKEADVARDPTKEKRSGNRPGSQGVRSINAGFLGILAVLLVLGLPWVKPLLGLPPVLGALISPDTPVEAVAALREDPRRPERLFHAMSYGSYLIWAAPEQPVFADPRIELYPKEQWLDYIALSTGHNVPQILEKYRFDGLLLDNEDQAGLLRLVSQDPAWAIRHQDEKTTYLVQRE
jgi:hypothetical protein